TENGSNHSAVNPADNRANDAQGDITLYGELVRLRAPMSCACGCHCRAVRCDSRDGHRYITRFLLPVQNYLVNPLDVGGDIIIAPITFDDIYNLPQCRCLFLRDRALRFELPQTVLGGMS